MNVLTSGEGAALIAALPVSLLLTRLMIALAQKRQWVVKPKADRWHKTPTALYGGVAIVLTFLLCSLAFLPRMVAQGRFDLIGLLIGGLAIFAVGLRDDIKPLNPFVKMVGQAMALTPYLVGMVLTHKETVYVLGLPFVVFWTLALMNSLNMLDNMDGLSAGVTTVFAGLIAVYGFTVGVPMIGGLGLLLALSCLGFLVFNLRLRGNAQIFMGDCGSMFLGILAAGLTVSGVCVTTPLLLNKILIPLLLLAVPIFDTTLVVIIRKREGRSVSQGGRDHSSHRLVYTGRNEKQAVGLLFGLELLVGAAALLVERAQNPALTFGLFTVTLLGFRAFGVTLARYSQPAPPPAPTPVPNVSPTSAPTTEYNSAVVRDGRTSRARG